MEPAGSTLRAAVPPAGAATAALRRGRLARRPRSLSPLFLTTFPVVIPFLVLQGDAVRALRISNFIALALLFLVGFAFGRATERPPVLVGIGMMLVGSAIVGMTIALGG
jgi:hypothetical protein